MTKMLNAYKNYWRQYVDFGGRTDVGGYWYVVLVNFIIGIILGVLYAILPNAVGNVISNIWSLVNLIPGLAIAIRRLRDAGQHWGNLFWILLPIVGWIILIVKLVKPSV